MKRKGNAGFTLLEIIVVIIIIAVLASLALPRFFKTVQYSYATEALQELGRVRQSVERCYMLKNNGQYTDCVPAGLDTLINLDYDPNGAPNAHFAYTLTTAAADFTITSTRDTTAGGDGTSTITIDRVGGRTGSGHFSGIGS